MMVVQDQRKRHHEKPLNQQKSKEDPDGGALTMDDDLLKKVSKLLPKDFVPSDSKLPDSFASSVLPKAQNSQACLAAAHILGNTARPSNGTLLIEAGSIPKTRPSTSMPALKSTSQILMSSGRGKLRWVLADEILMAYGFDPEIVTLSFLPQRSRGMVLVT